MGERGKLLYLESVRGIAAVVVMVHHLANGFAPRLTWDDRAPWEALVFRGDYPVNIFFVLSGFVLSIAYFRSRSIEAVRSGALRRYVRLVIPIGASVAVSYVLLRLGLYANREVAARLPDSEWLAQFFRFEPSIRSAAGEIFWRSMFNFDLARSYNSVLWTMQVEFFGSMLVFAFLALAGDVRNRWIVYGVLLGLFAWLRSPYFLFVAGMLLCDVFHSRPARASVVVQVLAGGLVLVSPFIGVTSREWSNANLPIGVPLIVRQGAAVSVVAGVLYCEPLQRALNWRPLVLLGRMSFPLYLFHCLVEFSLGCQVYLALIGNWSHWEAAMAASIVTAGVSLVIAAIGAFTLEPLALWGSRVWYERVFSARREKAAAV